MLGGVIYDDFSIQAGDSGAHTTTCAHCASIGAMLVGRPNRGANGVDLIVPFTEASFSPPRIFSSSKIKVMTFYAANILDDGVFGPQQLDQVSMANRP